MLEASGLLTRRIDGRTHHCRLRLDPLLQAQQWIEEQQNFWKHQFESLARYLDKDKI